MTDKTKPAIWFPAVRAGTGVDMSTRRLVAGLTERGIRAEIAWLPHRAEYAPWSVSVQRPPDWANVVHVNSWTPARFVPANLPLIVNLRHSVHASALRPYKGFARAIYHQWWMAPNERRLLHSANRIVAVSHYVADVARKHLADLPMDVIYNGIDTNQFRPVARRRHPDEPFRLLYVGTWQARKGVDLLPQIMRQLGAGFELRFTGGHAADKVRATLPSNMRDIGCISNEEVITEMQHCDALLFPSRSEGFGLVVAEAMACGLPVIVTRGSSLLELVDDGVTGILCTQDDVAEFVTAIRTLAEDNAYATVMSHNARQAATKRFGISLMLDMYVTLYKQVIKSLR